MFQFFKALISHIWATLSWGDIEYRLKQSTNQEKLWLLTTAKDFSHCQLPWCLQIQIKLTFLQLICDKQEKKESYFSPIHQHQIILQERTFGIRPHYAD